MLFRSIIFFATLVTMVSSPVWATSKTKNQKQEPPIVDIRLDDVEASLEETAPYGDPNAKPLEQTSRPDKFRRERRRLEQQTEDQMVEQLEISRMQDEKLRQQKLMEDDTTPMPVEESFSSNMTTTSTAYKKPSRAEIDSSDKSFFLGVGGGILNYPQAENLVDNGATAITAGLFLPWNLVAEVGFTYAFNQAEVAGSSTTEDMDMYQGSGAIKYFMEFSWFVPSAGVILAYTRRSYDGGDNGSNALDAGVVVNGDVRLTKNIYLGAEYRYMTNLDYERELPASRSALTIQKFSTQSELANPEAIDYHLLLLNAKYVF